MKKEYVRFPNSPVAHDGWNILAIVLVLFLSSIMIFCFSIERDITFLKPMAIVEMVICTSLLLFSIWFFRDPKRAPAQTGHNIVVSAADGTVLKVESLSDPRYGGACEKISIFMSPLNVHVNRAPIEGVVEKVEYIPGKFFAANLDKASTDNERNWVCIKRSDGVRIAFLQIAGFIARRIVCHVKAGDTLEQAQRYGMIRFGSRMEMFLPAGSRVNVKPGDKLQAGHTIVAELA